MKLVARKEDGLLIGAQIVGVGASDMIAEMATAIEGGMTAEDIALTIHAHPTTTRIVHIVTGKSPWLLSWKKQKNFVIPNWVFPPTHLSLLKMISAYWRKICQNTARR